MPPFAPILTVSQALAAAQAPPSSQPAGMTFCTSGGLPCDRAWVQGTVWKLSAKAKVFWLRDGSAKLKISAKTIWDSFELGQCLMNGLAVTVVGKLLCNATSASSTAQPQVHTPPQPSSSSTTTTTLASHTTGSSMQAPSSPASGVSAVSMKAQKVMLFWPIAPAYEERVRQQPAAPAESRSDCDADGVGAAGSSSNSLKRMKLAAPSAAAGVPNVDPVQQQAQLSKQQGVQADVRLAMGLWRQHAAWLHAEVYPAIAQCEGL
ncbi:hypothetical protein V8C86DRAFT_2550748 [Haematococcus lacustris]